MKKTIIFIFAIMMIFSCNSTRDNLIDSDNINNTIKKIRKKAARMLHDLEKKAKTADIEQDLSDFFAFVKEQDIDINTIKRIDGTEITDDFFETIQKEGWTNELKQTAKMLADNLESIDEAQLAEYSKTIKMMAGKLGINLFETVLLIADYLIQEAVEFSKSDMMKQLKKIWTD